MTLEDTVLRIFPWCADDIEGLGAIFSAYTERKRAQHLLDFEDLLLHWRAAVLDRDVGPVLAATFDHVLVDEYQDTSVVQADILRALRSRDARLTVVGDDAQAIYSFGLPPFAISWTFPPTSRGRRPSRWSRITGRPVPSSPWPTR